MYLKMSKNYSWGYKKWRCSNVCSSDGAFVGRGYVTDSTSAFVRVLTTKDEKIDKNFILEKIRRAIKRESIFLMKLTV